MECEFNHKYKIWFVGTGIFAAYCLENLTRSITFDKIITGMPTKSGRNNKLIPSHVENFCASNNLNVVRTEKLCRDENLINNLPDLIFITDFGEMIREPVLNSPKFGCWNIHPSLLPKFRGAAPIQRAILENNNLNLNASDLYKILAKLGSELALNAVNNLPDLNLNGQNEKISSYAPKILKSELEINFNIPAMKFNNCVRAFDMSGGAFVKIKNKRVKFWRVNLNNKSGTPGEILQIDPGLIIACEKNSVEIIEVQNEGKNKISGLEWANGMRLNVGDIIQ